MKKKGRRVLPLVEMEHGVVNQHKTNMEISSSCLRNAFNQAALIFTAWLGLLSPRTNNTSTRKRLNIHYPSN